MKTLRSHILKVGVVLLVCSGLMMGLARPADAAQSNKDFANWLQSLAKKTHSSDLKQKLASLEKTGGDLNQLIAQASRIVSENGEDFNLPSHAASSDLQQILLVEWNQYQFGNNAMTAVPSVESAKPVVMPQQQSFGPGHLKAIGSNKITPRPCVYLCAIAELVVTYPVATRPMSSGIAIGAP